LDDDDVLAALLDQVEYADLDNFEVAEELYDQVLDKINAIKIREKEMKSSVKMQGKTEADNISRKP
jgi:hypothetical protein